ncbi:MAG: methyltransferase domain-containing protein [Chitinophagales bacterium]
MNDRVEQIKDIFSTNFKKGKLISVADEYLERESNICPCCKHNTIENRITGTIQQYPVVSWLECKNCKVWYASRMPKQFLLKDAYLLGQQQQPVDESFNNYKRLANHILSVTNFESLAFGDEFSNILDFGCGNGELLLAIKNVLNTKKYVYSGIDIIVDEYQFKDDIHFFNAVDKIDKQNQLVIASAVLEHIPLFNETLKRLYDKTASGGLIYIRTPWHAPFKKIIKNLDLGFPGHLFDLSQDFWENIWSKIGCNIEIIHSAPSVNQTEYKYQLVRTFLADALKFPAYLHNKFRKYGNTIWWKYVGGWEIVVRKK